MLGRHGGARAFPILLDIARTPTADLKLRLTAIRYLGNQRNEQITGELIKIYDADKTKEIRYQVLRALADRENDAAAQAKLLDVAKQGETPELRIMAIRTLGDHGRMGLDQLIQLYNSEANVQIKQGLLRTFADSNDPRAQAKLLDIAKTGESIELRGFAIRQLSDKDDEQTVGQLVAMYDTEQNQQVKMALMRSFGDSKQKVAVRKLMTIARNDQSVELRKVAVRFLGESKDPEALKFLEELLK
jgi:HEAT repeat protein